MHAPDADSIRDCGTPGESALDHRYDKGKRSQRDDQGGKKVSSTGVACLLLKVMRSIRTSGKVFWYRGTSPESVGLTNARLSGAIGGCYVGWSCLQKKIRDIPFSNGLKYCK